LAGITLEGTAREEDRPRAVLADEGWFLPLVQPGPGDAQPVAFPAESAFILPAIHTAVPRAEPAVVVQGVDLIPPYFLRPYLIVALFKAGHPVGKFYRAWVS